MEPYEYRSLQQGEIRLLRLDALQTPGQPLSGTIIHYQLANPTVHFSETKEAYLEHSLRYDAVSYHWGNDTKTPFDIVINGDNGEEFVIRMTSTLNTLLRRLALPDEPRVLWVDAICINQITSNSNTEKGEQIQLMPDIYRIAACVQVYLGGESDNVPAALELLSSIADYSEHLDDSMHGEGEIGLAVALQSGFVLPPANDRRWPALRAFFRRPWFRRVWIIQEFVYATDVCVTCGDLEIDWHRLWLASKAFISNRQLMFHGYKKDIFVTKRLNEYREAHEGARCLHLVTDLRMRAWGYMSGLYVVFNIGTGEPSDLPGLSVRKDLNAIKGFEKFARNSLLSDRAKGQAFPYGRHSLLDLLHRTGNFQATHPVDRIYGLLGLAEDASGYKPIYSVEKTATAVSTEFAATFINNGHLALILATAGLESDTYSPEERPSWVPDWTSVRYSQDQLIGFMRFAEIENEAIQRKKDEKTKQTSSPAAADDPSPNQSSIENGSMDTSRENQEINATDGVVEARMEPIQTMNTESHNDLPPKLYNAAGDTTITFGGDAKEGMLIVRAISVGRVKAVLPGKLLLPVHLYESMVLKLGNVYFTGESIIEAFWRTLIANRTMHGDPPPQEFTTQYENMKKHDSALFVKAGIMVVLGSFISLPFVVLAIRYLPILVQVAILSVLAWSQYVAVKPALVFIVLLPILRWISVLLLVPVLLALAYYITAYAYPLASLNILASMGVTTSSTTDGLPADCAAYASAVGLTVNKHALCFTENRMMGLMPLRTKEEDIVVILHGCDVPYVVRPTPVEGYYRLVGECYVHGIMNGEMMSHDAKHVDIILA